MAPEKLKSLELELESLRMETLERLRIQESLAQSCFRALVLVNGGAIIALFTLIGSNAGMGQAATGVSLWVAFGAFAIGLTTTIGAIISGYFMQVQYTFVTTMQMWNKQCEIAGEDQQNDFQKHLKRGAAWEYTAIALVVLSLVSFVVGSSFCFLAFTR